MRKVLPVILLLSLLTSSQLFGQSESSKQSEASTMCSEKRIHNFSKNPILVDKSNIPHTFDIQNYKVNIDLYSCFISPYVKTFTASVVITSKADSSLSQITLNAVNTSLQIDSVRGAGTTFTHASNILTIPLARTYAPGELFDVKIYYKHKSISDGAFYVSSGMVFTDCEPEGARMWLPCWDKPSDKATLDLTAKVPATVKLGANGKLVDSVKNVDTIYYHWVSRDPIATYLMVMAGKVNYNLDILKWVYPTHTQDTLPIRLYYNSGETISSTLKNQILGMTTYFSNTFVEHPFEKNGFAALNSQFVWGGMENQSLTTICPGCWGENLVSHEYAHQWFGDMISPASWADIFLNEGFATYCEALWVGSYGGYSSYKSYITGNASSYMSSNPGWAISNPTWVTTTPDVNTLFNTAITYDKGACVIHMLRYVMGDTAFFAGIKDYTSTLKYKNAKIDDFRAIMAQHYTDDLNWFFNSWIYQPNHPLYNIQSYAYNNGSGWLSRSKVTQTQSGTFFKMVLTLKINFTDGTSETKRVFNTVNNEEFYFVTAKQPSSITFDPDNDIVIKTATSSFNLTTPVELTSFTANTKDNFVTLNWQTATETNNKGFSIERASVDGTNDKISEYKEVSFVEGKGTSGNLNNYSFTEFVKDFGKYAYRLKQVDLDGTTSLSDVVMLTVGTKPESYQLYQNYPNPFNPSTVIKFEVPVTSYVRLEVFNTLGEKVALLADGTFDAGVHYKEFDASKLSSGIYFYSLSSGNVLIQKKMLLIK